MIVVSDASPIRYLSVLGYSDLLPQLFDQVAIPRVVLNELLANSTPASVRDFARGHPEWLQVHDEAPRAVGNLSNLDPGECATILLAERLNIPSVLMDDAEGRKIATERGLKVTGLIGILGRAAELRLIDFEEAIAELGTTNFRVDLAIIDAVRLALRHG